MAMKTIMKESDRLNDLFMYSEDMFFKVFNLSPSPMAISLFEDGCFIDVNTSFLMTFGFKREEVIGFTSKELNLFVDYEDRKKMLDAIKQKGEINSIETNIRCKDGNILTGLFSANIIESNGNSYLNGIKNQKKISWKS